MNDTRLEKMLNDIAHYENNDDLQLNKKTWLDNCKFLIEKIKQYEDSQKQIRVLEIALNILRKERCYICRPNDPEASEEGCKDCDEKSDLHQELKERKEFWLHQIMEQHQKIKSLEFQVARMKKALEPFAKEFENNRYPGILFEQKLCKNAKQAINQSNEA